ELRRDGAHGQLDDERRASSRAGALGAHVAAVQLDEVAHDREAEPETAEAARRRAVVLPESLEDEGQEPRVDAASRVADGDRDVGNHAPELAANASAGRRELHGVRQEVPEDLLQAPRVSIE